MRGLYTHASDRMRGDLRQALQIRWEDSLEARAAIAPHSPVPLLDTFLAPFRDAGDPRPPDEAAPTATVRELSTRGGKEKMISQISPKRESGPILNVGET